MPEIIDLRSDTVTKPTPEMYQAMANANLGDDFLGDDSDVRALERLAADTVGKEAALFLPTGTMANLIALLCLAKPGNAVALEAQAHTYMLEAAGMSVIGGLMPVRIPGKLGVINPDDLEKEFHAPFRSEIPISLLCLENTHNLAGGTVITPQQTKALADVAHANGAQVYIDGARIFNSAIAQGLDVETLTRDVDSVMFSLSKGLSCPVGSVLCGSAHMIQHARHLRARLGGGMRQSAILAACGIVALNTMIDRLADDNANARMLAERLSAVPGIEIDMATVQTNMVYFTPRHNRLKAPELVRSCAERGVKFFNLGPDRIRLVTHKDVTKEQCERAGAIIGEVMRS